MNRIILGVAIGWAASGLSALIGGHHDAGADFIMVVIIVAVVAVWRELRHDR